MIQSISLRDFQSFESIVFDLSASRGSCKNLAAIFGENGSGKSHLIDAARFLSETMSTAKASEGYMDLDSGSIFTTSEGLGSIARRRIRLGSDGGPRAEYAFRTEDVSGTYLMAFDRDGHLIEEELTSTLEGRRRVLFHAKSDGSRHTADMDDRVFSDRGCRERFDVVAEMMWGRHTLLSLLCCEHEADGNALHPGLVTAMGCLSNVSVYPTASGDRSRGNALERGTVRASRENILDAYGKAISRFLLRVCTDIKGAHYEKQRLGDDISYNLVIEKRMCGQVVEIPVGMESDGIRNLIALLPGLLEAVRGRTVFIDDADSGIHEKMFRDIVMDTVPEIHGQLVMVCHSTGLMERLKPSSTYLLIMDAEANKGVCAISDITVTQKTNNNRNRYLSGKFGALPCSAMPELGFISDCLKDEADA